VLVGKQAQQAFAGLEWDSTFRFGDAAWTVVGVFEADGSIVESEIWAEATLL
jgi:putative ABC transport system permease protein